MEWKGAKERYFSLSNPRRLGWGYDQVVPTLVIRYMNYHTFTLGSGTERQLLVVVARSSPQEMPAQTELLTSLANNILLNTNPRLLKIAKEKMLTWFVLFLLRFHQLRSPPLWSSRIRNSIRLWIWAVPEAPWYRHSFSSMFTTLTLAWLVPPFLSGQSQPLLPLTTARV